MALVYNLYIHIKEYYQVVKINGVHPEYPVIMNLLNVAIKFDESTSFSACRC
jgi:hypothetical protein